jgi:hypothetical protein
MLKRLIVVDYQEGAGGEFVANWLSAHFGQKLEFDQQAHPNYLQKWFNSHSLVKSDWHQNFSQYLLEFNQECAKFDIDEIAVPYHLYKFPHHVNILSTVNHTRFVRINCKGYESEVFAEFERKVLDRVLTNFAEIKFVLQAHSREHAKNYLELFQQKKLTYRHVWPHTSNRLRVLPSQDVEIHYNDFFANFDQTATAYQALCNQLDLLPQQNLLTALIERNKKNITES